MMKGLAEKLAVTYPRSLRVDAKVGRLSGRCARVLPNAPCSHGCLPVNMLA